jgi:hypothetical protein
VSDGTDHDGDGWSGKDGDCNDCDPLVNPGAFDVASNGKDDDCSGKADDEPAGCDANVALEASDAMDGAHALDLCRTTTASAVGQAKTWGVLGASWVKPDGTPETDPLGHGALDTFGPSNKAPSGARMLALSSGTARAPNHPGYKDIGGYDKGYTSGTPAGFPHAFTGCTASGTTPGAAHDGAALDLVIRVPTNAKSFTVSSSFFAADYPDFVCSQFNDFFVTLVTPAPAGVSDGNVVFDGSHDPVSVDSTDLLQSCAPQTAGGKTFACLHGASPLGGTGFDTHGGSGWLTTRVPVTPGSTIKILVAVWDSSDGVLDSTALLDGFQWSTDSVPAPSTVGTTK